MTYEWELYRIVLAVHRAGSLRKAQQVLGLSQPTIGMKLDRLEELTGHKIFFRTNSGLAITDDGRHVLRVAEAMEQAIQNIEKPNKSYVTVHCSEGFGGYWFLHILSKFHEHHPNIRLNIQTVDWHGKSNIAGDVDLVIGYNKPKDADAVILTETTVTVKPFCVKSYAEKYGVPKDMDDLLNFPVCSQDIHYDKTNPTIEPWAEMLEKHPNVIYSTNSSLGTVNVTKAGLAISIQPIGAADTEPDAIMMDFFTGSYNLYMYTHKLKKDYLPIRNIIELFKLYVFKNKSFGLAKAD